MTRMVRDVIEVRECASLERLIEQLIEARARLPAAARAEVRFRGDDVFGRLLSIAYLRPQTEEEQECEARCGDAYLESLLRKLGSLQGEIEAERAAAAGLHLAA